MTNETIKQYLEQLGNGNTSTSEDDAKIQKLMRVLGSPNCVVTCGIVYLDGHGTIENPPMSIQQVVKVVLKVIEKNQEQSK